MTRWILLPFALAFALSGCDARNDHTNRDSEWSEYTATAYSVEGTTSTGDTTREGHTVAADPQVLPMGTAIEVRGAGDLDGRYVVKDEGPKVQGRRIDIFVNDAAKAREFGKRTVQVRVVQRPDGKS